MKNEKRTNISRLTSEKKEEEKKKEKEEEARDFNSNDLLALRKPQPVSGTCWSIEFESHWGYDRDGG